MHTLVITGGSSESYLFSLLEEYKSEIRNLISRRQYNDRRKFTANLYEQIRQRVYTNKWGVFIAKMLSLLCKLKKTHIIFA